MAKRSTSRIVGVRPRLIAALPNGEDMLKAIVDAIASVQPSHVPPQSNPAQTFNLRSRVIRVISETRPARAMRGLRNRANAVSAVQHSTLIKAG